jgi:hypothetical protein
MLWLIVNFWPWVLVPVAIWLLRGLWVATQRPRVWYLHHSKAGRLGRLVTVRRQQLLPPWLQVTETWFVPNDGTFMKREGDGKAAMTRVYGHDYESELGSLIRGALTVGEARAAELEELAK